MMDQDIVAKAMDFATRVHEGQVRNDAQQIPYLTHVAEVAELVEKSGGTEKEIAAAWLHDTVEHTSTTLGEIAVQFGDDMGALLNELTDPEEFESMPIPERKDKQAARVKGQSASAQRVKLADQTSNVQLVGSGVLLDTDPIESLDYMHGAKKIADVCAGVSPYLDALFTEAYQKGKERYSHI